MFKTVCFSSALIAAVQAWGETNYSGVDYGKYDAGYGKESYGGYGGYGSYGIGGLSGFGGLDRSVGQGLGNGGFGQVEGAKGFGGDVNDFDAEAYGVDNQYYGTQGFDRRRNNAGGFADGYLDLGLNNGNGNDSWDEATSHNSYRQGGHQGEGHNQWVDNAWNQWGTNNHWDTQKSVDNKWGNQSGKINVNLNSVSGHYDKDYGHQQRGLGYEGHQNVSGEIGYTIGLGGHSFGYEEGTHSFGYDNDQDYGYGGWANNLGAWNHGANFDNFGDQFVETGRDQYNDARDTANIKQNRRVGFGYGDLEELDQDDERQNQYGNFRIGASNLTSGTRNNLDVFAGRGSISDPRGSGFGNAGFGVDIADFTKGPIYDSQRLHGRGLENGYAGASYAGVGGYSIGHGPYGRHNARSNDYALSENNDFGYGTKAFGGYDSDFSQRGSRGFGASYYGYGGKDDYGLGGYRGQLERYDTYGDYGDNDYGYGRRYGRSYGYDEDDYGYGDDDYGYGRYGGYGRRYGQDNGYGYAGNYGGYGESSGYARPLGGSILGRSEDKSYSYKW